MPPKPRKHTAACAANQPMCDFLTHSRARCSLRDGHSYHRALQTALHSLCRYPLVSECVCE
jgi:hypothetical protein